MRVIRPGDTVYDLGANVGFYTLLASRLAGSSGRVFAFEPVPRNIRYLERHLLLNGCCNVTVIEAAVAETSGTAHFGERKSYSEGRLVGTDDDERGAYSVRVVALDDLVQQGELLPPRVLKIDVEGAEYRALQGCRSTLTHARPSILLSTHSRVVREQCVGLLAGLDYDVQPMFDPHGVDTQSELFATPRTPA